MSNDYSWGEEYYAGYVGNLGNMLRYHEGNWITETEALVVDWNLVASGSSMWDGWEVCYLTGIRVAKRANYGK